MIILDCEVYRDYFLCLMRNRKDESIRAFEIYEGGEFERDRLINIMGKYLTGGFNSLHYDLPIIAVALREGNTQAIFRASKQIIELRRRPSEIVAVPRSWDHIDIKEVAPGVMIGLKQYGGRLHTKKLQDLPYDPDAPITPEMRVKLRKYCENDLQMTAELFDKLDAQVELRKAMGTQYKVDLRSKSDAQIAEAVLIHEIQVATKNTVMRPAVDDTPSRYRCPEWLEFQTPQLKELKRDVLEAEFNIAGNGKLIMPPKLADRHVEIGHSTYKLGIGGLHSTESCVSHYATKDRQLIDVDMTSYYPFIILGQRLYPPQCGPKFLDVYKSIVDRRIAAKKAKDTVTADSLKITINGSFGKLGSSYSKLYAPDLFKQVTITGQLALLMLIEALELKGITVVSGNTDGIVTFPHTWQLDTMRETVKWFEARSSYQAEETHYRSIHNRDVNSYIAVKLDGSTKGKGFFAEPGLQKNPQNNIIQKSIARHLSTGENLEALVRSGDITDYLTIRNVTGGGHWRGRYLGKTVRWYWSTDGDPILYLKNGNRVATSEGCKPAMTLHEGLPPDLDMDRYVRAAYEALEGLGVW
ncbi:MAG: hypothetical protein ACOYBW_08805 [Fluviibacter phosphoraccumulans]